MDHRGKPGVDDWVAQDIIARSDVLLSEDDAVVRWQYECCDNPM